MSGAIVHGADLTADVDVTCDVCIVGSGAGGAVLAAGLAQAGLKVVMLEEGGAHTRRDFTLHERDAMPMLYQERGSRTTADLAITVLQGRSVGGGTTVNWTTCYRTPDRILDHWRSVHGVDGLDAATLTPHWEAIEQRLNIHPWEMAPNGCNSALAKGCAALGWEHKVIRRNVNGCMNSGYCGMGCPVDGKQAMHVTFVPDAVAAGMTLYADTRADRFEVDGGRVVAVHGTVLVRGYDHQVTGRKVVVRPKVAVSSGGAINGPALLIKSGLTQGGLVGRRTFLHPVDVVLGLYDDRIDPWYGAPQSVASHQFIDRGPDELGFFLESAPLHPMLGASAHRLMGAQALQVQMKMANSAPFIALHVDGLAPGDDGGAVSVKDGRISLDYPITDRLKRAFRASHEALVQAHLAAGAREAFTCHVYPQRFGPGAEIGPGLDSVAYGAHEHAIFTAHQMGGCPMGADPSRHVVDGQLRFRGVDNLFVVDGSVFPTALGVNPSESIYGLAHWARKTVGEAV